jgi:HPt (histidine-containing phosphotransfer) domain-containing protein
MSANVYKEDKLAAQESGMDDFIEKPLEKRDIENKLIKLINNEFVPHSQIVKESKSLPVVVKENSKEENKQDSKNVDAIEEDSEELTITGAEMKKVVIAHLESNFNPDIANKLFLKAMDSVVQYVNRIEENFKTKDIPALVEDFHILKGVCSNIGLHDIASRAGELQKLSENGDFLPIFKPKNKLIKELNLLINEVK